MALLDIRNLHTVFHLDEGDSHAVDGVSFSLDSGETLGLVGESGCGKSVTMLSVMRLIQTPPGDIASGEILFKGENLLKYTESKMQSLRGNQISMIFQEPMTALNPVFTVGNQITEAIRVHTDYSKKQAQDLAVESLARVGVADAERRLKDYPHQLSGGLRQRVMIAMALATEPDLLIADEPTTALDVTIQAQILELIQKLQKAMNMAMVLVTHDLGVVAQTVDKVAVMYAGKIVEQAETHTLFGNPLHPYTQGLLNSLPRLDNPDMELTPISGVVPDPLHFPSGCRFHPRCSKAIDICRSEIPLLESAKPNHLSACWRAKEWS